MAASPGPKARQGILSLTIKDKNALYAAYMQFVKNGGLFIPTTKKYNIGDEVFMLLSLMEEAERLPVAGKITVDTPERMRQFAAEQGAGKSYRPTQQQASKQAPHEPRGY